MKKCITDVLRITLAVLTVISVLSYCVSCTVRAIAADELSAGYERSGESGLSMTDETCAALSDFYFEVFKNTVEDDGKNEIFSPLSLIMCMGLAMNGAEGDTLSEIEGVLGVDRDTLNRTLYTYVSSLVSEPDSKFLSANSVWLRNTPSALNVKEKFLSTNAEWYGADVYSAPFDRTILDDINLWVRKNTDGMIKKILDTIPEETVIYLINTVLFDARWREQYEDRDVKRGDFYNRDGSTGEVSFLHSTEGVYIEGDNAKGFVKSYKKGYAFVGILPGEDTDIYEYINSLNGDVWQRMWTERSYGERVICKLPEFEYTSDMDLKNTLTKMGVTDIFDSSRADLSSLGDYKGAPVYISGVRQVAKIELDRNGTRAAAVTVMPGDAGGSPPKEIKYVYLDRPFVYMIVDTEQGLPLFIGAVDNLR